MTTPIAIKHLYFRQVMKRRKSCPNCRTKTEEVYSVGEYVNAKWRTVQYLCGNCTKDFLFRVKEFEKRQTCIITFVGYRGEEVPFNLSILRSKDAN